MHVKQFLIISEQDGMVRWIPQMAQTLMRAQPEESHLENFIRIWYIFTLGEGLLGSHSEMEIKSTDVKTPGENDRYAQTH